MALAETLIVSLGSRFGKLLLKNYLEEPGEIVGSELLDIAKGKIKDTRNQREAQRQFERLGDRIAEELLPVFQVAAQSGDLNAQAVVHEIAKALDALPSSTFVVKHDLDPAKIAIELKKVHALPRGQFSAPEEDLYQRVLIESSRYIVEVAAKLPRFEVVQAQESLQRLSRIRDIVEDTAKRVRSIEGWVGRQEDNSASQRFETDYRLAVMRNLDYVELFGADLSFESRRQSLSVAYVSLNLEARLFPPSLLSSMQGYAVYDDENSAESLPVEAVLDSLDPKYGGLLLIRGEAGSGKSTLFRWAGIESAKGGGNWQTELFVESVPRMLTAREVRGRSSIDSWRTHIPFLIRLRDCQGGKLPPPDHFPEMIAKEIGSSPPNWIRSVLKVGRGLILLDGIDEIPDAHRVTVRDEIEAIVREYPGNYVVVSTRPEAVPRDWLSHLGFREARVNPMSDLDRERFVDKWHEAVAMQLEVIGKPYGDLQQLSEELKQKIAGSPPVARLATNPLLCAMICALHRDRGQKLPESQSELCEALCQVLLHRRERESGLDILQFPAPYRNLMYPQKKAIVQEIAHYMVLNEESSISVVLAQDKVADALRVLSGQSEEDSEVVCRSLVERSGMLREAKPGYIDFIHNTFKEYLAADRFANAADVGLLVRHASDPTWRRIIQFAAATSRQGFADDLIQRILNVWESDETSDVLRSRQLLGLQCRALAIFVDPDLEKELDKIARAMFPPGTMQDAEALAIAGEFALPFLSYRESMGEYEAAACIRTLRLIGTRRARAILRGYLGVTQRSVISELAQAVNPLSIVRVVQWIRASERLPEGIRSQIKDLSPLSGLSSLHDIDLSGAPISDVSPLSSLSSLVSLNLSRSQVSDISPLSTLSNLKSLNLGYTKIEDLSSLSELRNLVSLDLSETQVLNVFPLSGLSSLEVLSLIGTPVSEISHLSRMGRMRSLYLAYTQVSDVSPLSHLGDLQGLYLGGTQVSDVTPLSNLTGLKNLHLRGTNVSDVSSLTGLRSLENLDLSGTHVSDVSPLSGLSNLKNLDLRATQVSDVSTLSGIADLAVYR